MDDVSNFSTLDRLAEYLREVIEEQNKKISLIFAHNGIGKTRLSMAFKELGKKGSPEGRITVRDTLYFNAFTEDLFSWDNDLENDFERVLRMNMDSVFFAGLAEFAMENRIRSFLHRYTDIDFLIDYAEGSIFFWRGMKKDADGKDEAESIKISRGEENLFIWCFFLAVAQLAIEGEETYGWVRYLYIDDPISSLDENNAICVAAHLASILRNQDRLKVVISSHHTLFFNVLCNEFNKPLQYFLDRDLAGWKLRDTSDTPRFYHVAMLMDLRSATRSGELYTYHFAILRSVIEKTAVFHGFRHFGDVIKRDPDDEDGRLHFRYVNLLSHGNYSLFEPVEMTNDNKQAFKKILDNFMGDYRFDPKLLPRTGEEESAA